MSTSNEHRHEARAFTGDRQRPLTATELAEQRPILSDGSPPPEIAAAARRKSIFVSGSNMDRPDISIARVESGFNTSHEHGWRIDLTLNENQHFAIPTSVNAIRAGRDVFRQARVPGISHHGHRPAWLDQFYLPRTVPGMDRKPLRRLNGRTVRPLWVFGDFAPRLFRDSSYPWGCIGSVRNNEGMSGTGVLVGRNFVVTAGHLIPWSSGSNGWVQFTPADYLGTSLFGSTVTAYATDARGYDDGDTVAGYDWAIVKLDQPLGDLAGYMGCNSYSSDWEDVTCWTMVGYPGGAGPFWQNGISVNDDDDDDNGGQELETENGDTLSGYSGGPMFAWWGADPRVIGVVSGEEEEYKPPFSSRKDNVIASGSGFTDLIGWGRSNW